MKRIIIFGLLVVRAGLVLAVTMNFHGSMRTEATLYNKLDLGRSGTSATKSFISGKALLSPNLVVDDHFSIRSQWSLLTSPTFTPDATLPLGIGQGGYVFGDASSSALVLNRAWLEWTSDFGVLSLGRMPVAWGYGLIWDAGTRMWDDFESTLDRLEYRLHFGNVIGSVAYSKGRKLSVQGSANDQEFYTVYLRYHNPQMDVEGGILFENQVRTVSQQADLVGTSNPARSPNPYKLPPGSTNTYPLANKVPAPFQNNVLDVYLKKTVGYFTFGGEVGWMSGKAADYNGNGNPDSLNALGSMLSASYEYHKIKAFMELLYASGDSNLNADHLNGFVSLHRNRRPGLILGRELLGPYHGNQVAMGSPVVYGNNNTFSGVVYARPGLRVEWSRNWASGIEFIYAQKAARASGENGFLGFEVDLGTDYAVYRNFDVGLTLGYLFPGTGLQVASPKGPFGVRLNACLKF